MAGVGSAFENACILNGVGVIAIIVNTCVITKYGRRRAFLVTGLLLCGFVQLIVAVVYTVQPGKKSSGKVIVGMSVIYIVGYNVSVALLPVKTSLTFTGSHCNLCMVIRWRDSIAATALLHFWSWGFCRFLWRMARNVRNPPP